MPNSRMQALIGLVSVSILFILNAHAKSDKDWYCKGKCEGRYDDGLFLNGMCACIDWVQYAKSKVISLPKRSKGEKDVVPPRAYYGVDEMHVPTWEPPPTAPMDF